MGYCRIVQYGDITELYEYEKNINNTKKKKISSIAKKRAKQNREYAKQKGTYIKSKRSRLRTINNFFRLCHHNNYMSKTIHFVTLTFAYDITLTKASRIIARFMERIKDNFSSETISYISVSELTKKGRYHFHLLVYNLPTETCDYERETRYYQRQFEHGYVDIRLATYKSAGIAGYMAKYMAKAMYDNENEKGRFYNCSRNIEKVRYAGSNTLNTHLHELITYSCKSTIDQYNVPYLGKCIKTKFN